jgi:hypothetical protein
MGAVNMTPTGRINLPVACPESASDNCQGVVSLWVWTVVPHAHDHRDHAHKPVAGERGPAYRHKRRRSRVGRKEFNVLAGKTQRVPMNVGRNARDRACRQGRLPVTVIVRHRVGDEWKLSSERLVLEPQRCRSN